MKARALFLSQTYASYTKKNLSNAKLESWKKEMNMLKVKVNNKAAIEKEWTDVENTWGAIKDSVKL